MKRLKRKLNVHFRTHANYHVLTKNWKYKLYCVLIKITDEFRRK